MKYIMAVLALAVSVNANAANWTVITDGQNSERLLIDLDSIVMDSYESGNGPSTRIYGTMQYLLPDRATEPFQAVIDVKECLTKQSGLLLHKYNDGDSNVKFWTSTGPRLYDSEGSYLCGYAIGTLKAKKEKQAQKPKTSL
jgi:hypothetical protein